MYCNSQLLITLDFKYIILAYNDYFEINTWNSIETDLSNEKKLSKNQRYMIWVIAIKNF